MLKPIYENIPQELKDIPQWVNWRVIRRDGKKTKPPYQPDGKLAESNNPLTWSPFSVVVEAAPRFNGIGIVLMDDNPSVPTVVGIDFDHCRCPAFDILDPEIACGLNMVLPHVADYVTSLNSYTELSPSGEGLHVFLKGRLPVDGKKKGDYEAYQSGRYLTVTGHVLDGFPLTIEHRQMEVDAFYKAVFGATENPPQQEIRPRLGIPLDSWRDRLERTFQSKSGSAIKRLWEGDHTGYPSQSEAELALCSHLAFWFDGDLAAMDEAFRLSGLIRPKWDEKHHSDGRTYGAGTIDQAVAGCKSFYCDPQTREFSYKDLLARITATDDISVLVNEVAMDVRASGLSQTEIHNLIKTIAKKTGGTVKTLCSDTRGARGDDTGFGKIDHLQAAKQIVADFCRDDLTYVSTLRIFRQWDGRVWAELDDRTINEAVVGYLDGKTDGVTKNTVESVTDLIRTLVFRQDVTWDADTGVIPVKNGELAWNDGQWILKPHVRGHYRTTLIPVEYDSQARAPRFEQFLFEVFEGDSDAEEKAILICEMIGYSLTTSCEYEKFIMLIGPGANGKTVLLDVLRRLIGPGQVAAVQPEQMDNRFQRAHLCGKLANIVTEIKEGGEIADAALKAITSGELTTAEHKFKKPFDFQPFSTCWFGTNHMPHTRDFSDALFRRALIVEFNRVFQEHEQDKRLKSKLAAELPGILRLAVTAFAGVIQCDQFTMPESCVTAKEQWRVEADQAAQFIQDCCVMEPDALVQSSTLFKAYQDWAESAGIRRTLNRINFSKRIQRLGGKLNRTGESRQIAGVKLVSVPQ
jgi:putative DNA primase/helicase